MADQLARELGILREDVVHLMGDLASTAQALVDVGKEQAGEKKDKMARELDQKVVQLRRGIERARESGIHAKHTIEHGVSEHPWVSVVSAFCAGALLGGLVLRKKS